MSLQEEAQTSKYLEEVRVEPRLGEPDYMGEREVEEIAVVDDGLREDIMVFEEVDRADAIAFADGYAYCKLMAYNQLRRLIWSRITSLVRRYTP